MTPGGGEDEAVHDGLRSPRLLFLRLVEVVKELEFASVELVPVFNPQHGLINELPLPSRRDHGVGVFPQQRPRHGIRHDGVTTDARRARAPWPRYAVEYANQVSVRPSRYFAAPARLNFGSSPCRAKAGRSRHNHAGAKRKSIINIPHGRTRATAIIIARSSRGNHNALTEIRIRWAVRRGGGRTCRELPRRAAPKTDHTIGNVWLPILIARISGKFNARASHVPSKAPISPSAAETRQPPCE